MCGDARSVGDVAMSIAALLNEFRGKFKNRVFDLAPGESILSAVKKHEVPNEFGVYVISSLTHAVHEIIYIGKAGTFIGKVDTSAKNQWKKQGLSQRLTNKQGKERRVDFFKMHIEKNNLSGLRFEWFVTFEKDDDSIAVLPVLAEAQLLQAFIFEHHRLPELNASA